MAQPYVLQLYAVDKLLAREITYQTIGNGLNKFLKEAKKALWPSFPIYYGVYVLENYKHAGLEVNKIQRLELFTISNR